MGLFTRYGNVACDITPLTGLAKRRLQALAQAAAR
jgi:NH3-dependent NAD+ synthetase